MEINGTDSIDLTPPGYNSPQRLLNVRQVSFTFQHLRNGLAGLGNVR